MPYQDDINPDWPAYIVNYQIERRQAEAPAHRRLIDAIWHKDTAVISAAQGGAAISNFVVTLTSDSSQVMDNRLIGKMPLQAHIGSSTVLDYVNYNWSAGSVFDSTTGTHNLGDVFPAGTKIAYLVKQL